MGVKGLHQLLTKEVTCAKMQPTDGQRIRKVCFDFACLMFRIGYGINMNAEDDDLVSTFADHIVQIIKNVAEEPIVAVVVLDGNRPPMKFVESEKRKRYATKGSDRVRDIIKRLSSRITDAVCSKALPVENVVSVEIVQAEYEADSRLVGNDVAVTVDGDVVLLGAFQSNLEYIVLLKKPKYQIIDMCKFRNKFNAYDLLKFSVIAGNDYLPSLYSPKDFTTLYKTIVDNRHISFIKLLQQIVLCTRPRGATIKDEETVQGIVVTWLEYVYDYLNYVIDCDPSFLNSSLEEDSMMLQLKKCQMPILFSIIGIFDGENLGERVNRLVKNV